MEQDEVDAVVGAESLECLQLLVLRKRTLAETQTRKIILDARTSAQRPQVPL
jgi:hypothetical protein